jgi:hypothetical protein
MKFSQTITIALLASLSSIGTAHGAILVSYEGEAPGVQNTTAVFNFSGVETFDELPANTKPNTATHTFVDAAHPATTITMDFKGSNGVQINPADQYGGAGGTGNYAVAFRSDPFTLDLSSENLAGGVNYFGYWLSALDAGNVAKFYGDKGQLLFTFNPKDVLNVVSKSPKKDDYYGNPNTKFNNQNGNEPYIFLNFFNTGGVFSKVEFEEAATFGGGYESDNYTVGHYTKFGQGTFIPTPLSTAAPEPATWAMMIMGFGVVGYAMRKRAAVRQVARAA